MEIEVGWVIKWRSHFGIRTGKVVDIATTHDGKLIGYYVTEDRGAQGFPGVSYPMLVSPGFITEVVSRD